MMADTDTVMTGRKKVYFRMLSLALVILVFFLIEILLRLFSVGSNVHLFIESDADTKVPYLKINPYVGEKYFTRFQATSSTNDQFLKHKPENGYRIFVLGSSTLFGYPYDHNLMASRILHQRLQNAYPDLAVEVVNTSITAINSITLKDFTRQVLKHKPDALLIYAGHNEFYGAFGVGSRESMGRFPVITSVHFRLMNLRLYQLLRSAMGHVSRLFRGEQETGEARGTLMKRIVQDDDIPYGGEKYGAGIRQYRHHMESVLEMAQKSEVDIFISDLVSNIRDLPPLGTLENPDDDPRNIYQKALISLDQGDTAAARDLFYDAKDLDPVRFRASEEINEIIYELADRFKATLLPTVERFKGFSPGGLIGNNLLTEHVHPNIEGQFLLADAFFTGILISGKVGLEPDPDRISREYYRHHWGYTALDSLIGMYKIEYLKSFWPFSIQDGQKTLLDTFQATGMLDSLAFSILTDPTSSFQSLHLQLAKSYEMENELEKAFREYRALITIDPFYARYYTQAASSKLKMNDLYAAENYLRESLQYGRDLLAFSLLGEIELVKHNFKDAKELFGTALKLAETDQMDENKRRELTRDLRAKISEAERLLQSPVPLPYSEYPQIVPLDIKPLYLRALSFSETETDSALYYFNRCLEINDCPLVNFQIGNILYMKQDLGVMHFYDKAYTGFARDPDFLVRYCVASLMNQEVSKAQEIFQIISVIAPQHSALPRLRQAIGQ